MAADHWQPHDADCGLGKERDDQQQAGHTEDDRRHGPLEPTERVEPTQQVAERVELDRRQRERVAACGWRAVIGATGRDRSGRDRRR